MDPWRQRLGSEPGAGREEAGEIRMLNHWAVGLRSGLLPEGCGVATPEIGSKKGQFWARFSRGFRFLVPGESFLEGFGRFLEVSRMFCTGVSPSMVRWEVSYEGKSFQKKLEFWSGPKFRKMSQMGQGAPLAPSKKSKKYWAQKGPGPKFGPMGPPPLLARVHASSPALLARVHASSASLAVY